MDKQNSFKLKYKLQDIKTTKFILEQPNKEKYKNFSIEFGVGCKIEPDDEVIYISLGVNVFDNEKHEYKLCEHIVEFKYVTIGLKNVERKGNAVKLPDSFLLSLLSISYSTLRGIIHEKCASTYLKNLIIPIIDPKDLLPKSDKNN